MSTKLFVGSLSFGVNDQQLNDFFSGVGKVTSANVISDRDTGRSKGFGFVEMESQSEAEEAIKTLNNKELDGRAVNVSIAKPRENRPQGSFGGSYNQHRRPNNRRY